MKRRHLFVLNPQSFPHKRDLAFIEGRIRAFFERGMDEECAVEVSAFPRDAILIVRDFLAGTPPGESVRVYAAGGGGIAFDCLNAIAGMPQTELALLPFGSTNDFLYAFGRENYALFKDIALQARAPARPTDIIRCGGNYALNFCSVGLETACVMAALPLNRRLERFRRAFPGVNKMLYLAGGAAGGFNKSVREQKYQITADGEAFEGRFMNILAANGPAYGAGLAAAPFALPDDGGLDVILAASRGPLRALSAMLSYARGGYWKRPDMFTVRRGVRRISIRSERPLFATLDGEPFFDAELDIELIPGAAQIVSVNGLPYRPLEAFHETGR